jgi:Raf kinase inhibitor-like YbhB/YbcL family protein
LEIVRKKCPLYPIFFRISPGNYRIDFRFYAGTEYNYFNTILKKEISMKLFSSRSMMRLILCVFIFFTACGGDDDDDDSGDSDDAADDAGDDDGGGFALASAVFEDGGDIPADYSCDNADFATGISPQLAWTGAPAQTAFFALTVFDPDGADTPHWGVFDIPADVTAFAEALRPEGALPGNAWEAMNYLGEAGYAGPCPPPGEAHHYVFTIYALDSSMPDFTDTPLLEEMVDLIQERLIDSGTLTGLFAH